MADRARLEKKSSSHMFTQIIPPHVWNEDSDFHYLRMTLPGLKASEVTIHVDKYGHLVVRGNRQMREHKYISFEESFDIPNNTNIEDADGFFEEEQIYCIAIPKIKQQSDQHSITIPNPDMINPITQDTSPTPKVPQDNKVSAFSPFPKYGSTNQPAENPNNLVELSTAEKSSKLKIAYCIIAILFALLVIAVAFVIKFHR